MKKCFILLILSLFSFGCTNPASDFGEGEMFAGSTFIQFGTYSGTYPTDSFATFAIEFKEDKTFILYGYDANGTEIGSTKWLCTNTEAVTYEYKLSSTTLTYTKSYKTETTHENVTHKFVFTKVNNKIITCSLLYTCGDAVKDSWGPVEISLI